MNETLLKNYYIALKQKYNAICLDIDGTLTKPDNKNIDNRIPKYISKILKNNVPILFITGRGETGLKEFLNEIMPVIKEKYNVNADQISKMYALTNDGLRLFHISENSNDWLDYNEYIVSPQELNYLNIFNQLVVLNLSKANLLKSCTVNYSFDSTTNRILNIRFVLQKNNPINSKIRKIVDEMISIIPSASLNVTEGIHSENLVLQVGVAFKSMAVEKAERIIGVPKNSMLRLGDCGNVRGNDFSMLDCPQGFSVDLTSGKNDCCFPIIDQNGHILKGVDATVYLLEHAKILSTICLEKPDKEVYKKKYARIEQKINRGRQGHLKQYDDIINEIFDAYDGINSVYDKNTGCIKIPIYLFELIEDNNPLKCFWLKGIDNKLFYSLRDNENYLLRGSKCYYYFLSNRSCVIDSDFNIEKDITSKANVIEWFENYIQFFRDAIYAVDQTNIEQDVINNKKMILGILDNARNCLLVEINHLLCCYYKEDNVLINLENLDHSSLLYKHYKTLLDIDLIMQKISFVRSFSIDKSLLNELLNIVESNINEQYQYFLALPEKNDYSKEFRAYREIDNFAENIITVSLFNDQQNSDNKIGICGLCYGGVELPIIYKNNNDQCKNVSILKFGNQISGYREKHSIEIRNFDIDNFGGLQMIGIDKNLHYILADDNLLTAKTMQLAINTMYDSNVVVDGLMVVRYPSINRIDQMFMENHGAVDYHYFFNYIKGLCFPSPYSWRDDNNQSKYEDSLGVFDTNRRKILECLYKNHDFKENTEVYKLKRKVKK